MSVVYENRKKKKYYLHQGKTKTGKAKYYFSMKTQGKLVGKIPEGFEIYEHPANAQVFLRKKQSRIITDIEKHLVNKNLKALKTPYRYLCDIKGKIITIFESVQNIESLKELIKTSPLAINKNESQILKILDQEDHYSPVMRFILDNKNQRTFIAERFCFKGSIDDWIYIDGPDSLAQLLESSVKHLGQDSFFEMY